MSRLLLRLAIGTTDGAVIVVEVSIVLGCLAATLGEDVVRPGLRVEEADNDGMEIALELPIELLSMAEIHRSPALIVELVELEFDITVLLFRLPSHMSCGLVGKVSLVTFKPEYHRP